jgi:carbohydrate esterase-like protein/GDSL-like lipase/acylhydrolase family protein
MKLRLTHSAAFIFILSIHFFSNAARANNDTLQASSLHCYGRFALNEQQHLELISSASYVGFGFHGKECRVYAYISNPGEHNYLQYELDGVYQKRIRMEGNNRLPVIVTATKNGAHTVWIYKTTEAHTGPIFIEKITGKDVKPLQSVKKHLIEFIGNSITCGAAADPSETPCGTGMYHDQHNAYYAYGPRVARTLGTDFVLSSVSGIGVYRNWNSDGPSMPQVYEKTDFQDKGERMWNFETFKPDIVSIALGTNDFSNGDGKKPRLPFDSAAFVSSYIKFVLLVKSKYPAAQIALLSSPMLNGDAMTRLQNYLSAVKQHIDVMSQSGKKIALYFFMPMHARGCSGHPNVEDHAILAEELVPFFRKLL